MLGKSTIIQSIIGLSLLGYLRGLGSNPLIQLNIYALGIVMILWTFKGVMYQKMNIERNSQMLFVISGVIGLILLYQSQTSYLKFSIVNELGRLLLPLITVASILSFLNGSMQIAKLRRVIRFLIFLLLLDCLWRLYLNGGILPIASRYSLKFGGLLFVDANFNGWIAAILYLYRTHLMLSNRDRIFLLFLILYSFSLAVYGGLVLTLIIRFVHRYPQIFRTVLYLFIIAIGVVFGFNIKDGSFATKVDIALSSFNLVYGASWNMLLFGLGSGNLKDFIGHGSHTMIGIAAEMGLVFVLIWFLLFKKCYMFKEANRTPLFFIISTGLISLWPVAYMSLPLFLFFIRVRYD